MATRFCSVFYGSRSEIARDLETGLEGGGSLGEERMER